MRKIYCIKCKKYKKFKKPKITYIRHKTLLFSIICDKCGSEDIKISREKNHLRY